MNFTILAYHASMLPALYRVCLLTAEVGGDASALFNDPDLLGHYYVGPYAFLEPELCFVLAAGGQPYGYILGTADSAGFARRGEEAWFAGLRARYPLPAPDDPSQDAVLLRLIHAGGRGHAFPNGYPAHLHIDLLPAAQGQGWGKRLMAAFCERLRTQGVEGVHLGVDVRNTNAIAFYQRVGFTLLREEGGGLLMGRKL